MAEERIIDLAERTARVQKAIEEYTEAAMRGEDTMELSSGAQIKLLRLPPLLLQRVQEKFVDPEPPLVEVEVHGEKQMQPNPDDPDYHRQLEAVASARGWASFDLVLLKGIEFEMPQDDEWLEELHLIGIEVGESKAARRLAYAKFFLIENATELEEVTGRVLAMSGVTPRAVDEAVKTVPG